MLRRPCTGVGDGARGGHQQKLSAVGLHEKKGTTSEKASPRDDSHDVCHGHVSQEKPAPATPKRKACQARCHLMSSPLRTAPVRVHGVRQGGRGGRTLRQLAAAGERGDASFSCVLRSFYSSTHRQLRWPTDRLTDSIDRQDSRSAKKACWPR